MAKFTFWLSPGEYLFLRLFSKCMLISMASGTGLFDQNSPDWTPTLAVFGDPI